MIPNITNKVSIFSKSKSQFRISSYTFEITALMELGWYEGKRVMFKFSKPITIYNPYNRNRLNLHDKSKILQEYEPGIYTGTVALILISQIKKSKYSSIILQDIEPAISNDFLDRPDDLADLI